MQLTQVMLFAMVTSMAWGHGIPIWEMLPRQDKMGQIMYVFVHLVDQTCSYSYIPDCHHVLTLHGLSNLVNMDEFALNRLDPFQSDARQVIWEQVMRGVWDLPAAYLPYYLRPQGDEMTNEIDSGFPSSPEPSSLTFLYPYVPIPNTHNKPVAAVSDPHPYSVKVAPPPGFSPNTHAPPATAQEVQEAVGEMTVRDSEVAPEERFAGWSDSEAILGSQQDEFDRWSDSDMIAGNQEPAEDIYASWSDADMTVGKQEIPEDRFAGWSDSGATADNQETQEDIYASWNDDKSATNTKKQTEADRYAAWSDVEELVGNQQGTPEDRYASWSDNEPSANNNEQETETNRYAAWSDSEAGLSDMVENRMPAGIQPTASFEPVMVESRVVVSRVAPPPSMLADHSVLTEQQTRTRRSVGGRPLLLPLLLLRQ